MHRAVLPPDPERRMIPPHAELASPLRVRDLLAPRQNYLIVRLDGQRRLHPVRQPDHPLAVNMILHLDDNAEAGCSPRLTSALLDRRPRLLLRSIGAEASTHDGRLPAPHVPLIRRVKDADVEAAVWEVERSEVPHDVASAPRVKIQARHLGRYGVLRRPEATRPIGHVEHRAGIREENAEDVRHRLRVRPRADAVEAWGGHSSPPAMAAGTGSPRRWPAQTNPLAAGCWHPALTQRGAGGCSS